MKVKYQGKEYNIPAQYLKGLKGKDRTAQIKSIVEKKKRPKTDFKSKRSGWVSKFEKKYGTKITDKKFIHEKIITRTGQQKIIDKGMGAYYSSGSRPNQTPSSWGLARLASVILGGPSRRIDKNIWEKYKR
tara:strand:- start:853 stop:1245 length:393 start_codon:yes stop_codon:yes gene_type:complete